MDITTPPLDGQVSPAPWLVFRRHADVPGTVRQVLMEQPEATADEIAAQLAQRGVQASPMVIAMWIRRINNQQTGPSTT